MDFDFAAILVGLTALTGGIWLVDILFFARARVGDAAAPGAPAVAARKEPIAVEYARSFFPVILIVLLVRSFIAEPFRIPSSSMMPTLLIGDFILVNKFAYGLRLPVLDTKVVPVGEPERGDVVVFRYPGYRCERNGEIVASGSRCDVEWRPVPNENYIKRVVGLPGDEVVYRNRMIYVNGTAVPTESMGRYIGTGSGREMTGYEQQLETLGEVAHQTLLRPANYLVPNGEGVWTVPAGQYFVMGDNRDNSEDSRFWGFVPEENLVGRAFLIWMNWDGRNGGVDFGRLGTVIH